MTASFSRKISTGPYENADLFVSETAEVERGEDPVEVIDDIVHRLRKFVDLEADNLRP